jgi:hypothetical protein
MWENRFEVADPECTSRGYERFAGQPWPPFRRRGRGAFLQRALHDGDGALCRLPLRGARDPPAWLDGYYGVPFLSRTGCFG